MSLVDLLVTILVATILITVGIGLMTYLVYKLRSTGIRSGEEADTGQDGRYFVTYEPPGREEGGEPSIGSGVRDSTSGAAAGGDGGEAAGEARG